MAKLKNVSLYDCGTEVISVFGGFRGMITCTSIRFGFVTYEITYYLDGEPRTTWMREEEFVTKQRKITIGFKV